MTWQPACSTTTTRASATVNKRCATQCSKRKKAISSFWQAKGMKITRLSKIRNIRIATKKLQKTKPSVNSDHKMERRKIEAFFSVHFCVFADVAFRNSRR